MGAWWEAERNSTPVLLDYSYTQHYLCYFSREHSVGSHGEIGRVDKHVSICTSTDNILTIKGGGKVGDCPVMVVVHGECPVGVEGGEGVRVGEEVHPHTAIRSSRQQVITRRARGRYTKHRNKLSNDIN